MSISKKVFHFISHYFWIILFCVLGSIFVMGCSEQNSSAEDSVVVEETQTVIYVTATPRPPTFTPGPTRSPTPRPPTLTPFPDSERSELIVQNGTTMGLSITLIRNTGSVTTFSLPACTSCRNVSFNCPDNAPSETLRLIPGEYQVSVYGVTADMVSPLTDTWSVEYGMQQSRCIFIRDY